MAKTPLDADGLLDTEDTVIVAARLAYPEYSVNSVYICQANRSFRPDLTRLGFYADKQIKPEIPAILLWRQNLLFTEEEAKRREVGDDPAGRVVAKIIRLNLAEATRELGTVHDLFILSAKTDSRTLVLRQPVQHRSKGAWTQGQRYTSEKRLASATTTDDLQ